MSLPVLTLCFLLRDEGSEVLLGRKLTGFGSGKVVGLGGHVEAGETVAEAAVREVLEESGVAVHVDDLRGHGSVTFRFPARPGQDFAVDLFTAERWTGEPARSAEIDPAWYPVDALPLDEMWDDARHWLPRVLKGETVRAEFTFDAAGERVVEADVRAE